MTPTLLPLAELDARAVRTVLAPAYRLHETADDGLCCGAGGAYAVRERALAGRISPVEALVARTRVMDEWRAFPGLDPDLRFDRHKAGIQANRYVLEFGLRLLPELYAVYNPMPYDGARDMEVELAIGLREAGYGVWQA